MPDIATLKAQMAKASMDGLAVVQDTDTPTAEKRVKLDKIEADIKAFSAQIADEEYLVEQRKKYMSVAGEAPPVPGDDKPNFTAKSVGQQLTESPGFKSIADKGNVGATQWSTGALDVKATLTETTAGGVTGSGLAQPQVLPGILPILFQRLTVADLMPSGVASSALIRYLKETVATNAAAAVAEGAAKPASTLNFSAVDEPIRKLATTLKVTDEMFEDVPALRSYIDARLGLFVQIQEEAQLLTGTGVAPNVTGILNRAGLTAVQPLGADTRPDAIYKEITKIRVASFLEVTGLVMHPTDWQTLRLSKDAQNQYYGGGPFTGAYGNGNMISTGGTMSSTNQIWGFPVVVTTAMTVGTCLLGAFATAAQVFRRGGLTVEATNSNEDDFLTNLVAIRAEERLGLALYRPSAFGTVSGL